jgi:Zn-dependent protease
MFITFHEVFDIAVMTALIGFLFMDIIPMRTHDFKTKFKLAAFSLAPVIILHELAHKFTAMAFGLKAVFHAFYAETTTLFLGMFAIIMKLSNFGFVFLVPGFVRICETSSGTIDYACATTLAANPLWGFLIAFAGPLMHLIFWIGSGIILNKKPNLSENWTLFFVINKRINKFLFIINMLPIPGIDGYFVFTHLGEYLGII